MSEWGSCVEIDHSNVACLVTRMSWFNDVLSTRCAICYSLSIYLSFLGWMCVILCSSRLVFRNSTSAMDWARRNKYFILLSKGVERDGWKFVLLARFSPVPSYIINYTLAATEVGFVLDFLLPTIIGCVPMILQNTSIGSLAGAAYATASGSKKSQIWSYVFPMVGILSSILISLRIKKYSTQVSLDKSNTVD